MKSLLTKEQENLVYTLAIKRFESSDHLRLGQSYWNSLHRLYPKIIKKLENTKYDCFFFDERIEILRKYLIGE